MYDIRQFKPTLYLVVVAGLTGFSMAAEAPALWLFCAAAIGINIWLVATGRFTPLPGWLAGTATLLSLIFIIFQIMTEGGPPLMFIGMFLVLLQLIKLYEQRANRDHAQIIVLSLLLMVAASINTASLVFGLLMAGYLVLALYCCLIFHLKVEADAAKAAFDIPPQKVSDAALQHDQRHFSRSMRRLTALVSIASVLMATVVFLFFPRGAGQGVLGQLQFRPPTALTGFQDEVEFDQINRIRQNDQVVAHVTVFKDDKPLEGAESIYLRGLTLDIYGSNRGKREWTRSPMRITEADPTPDRPYRTPLRISGPRYRQQVVLKPSGTRFLFALPGPLWFKPGRSIGIKYSPDDESIQTDPINLPFEYEVESANAPTLRNVAANAMRQLVMDGPASSPHPGSDADVMAEILRYTLLPEVTGGLAAERSLLFPSGIDDEAIAGRIEQHLKTTFSYTLDLTDSRDQFEGLDPVVAFLKRVKRGHCEYFASAMTLMCQSLNIPARMVVGFRCDEYNPVGGYYIVRQSHAHTWVEVLTPRGWVGFDPTSGREDDAGGTASLWQSIRHFFDYLDHKWAVNVVAYDTRDRQEVVNEINHALMDAAYRSGGLIAKLRRWRQSLSELSTNPAFWRASVTLIVVAVTLMAGGMVAAILWYAGRRLRLRKRAHRIGLDKLPRDERLRLARQLAFYDQLIQSLQKRHILRPGHLTPRQFAASLSFLPGEAYQAIHRLTELLYRIRYGGAILTAERQWRVERVVLQIARSIQEPTGKLRPIR